MKFKSRGLIAIIPLLSSGCSSMEDVVASIDYNAMRSAITSMHEDIMTENKSVFSEETKTESINVPEQNKKSAVAKDKTEKVQYLVKKQVKKVNQTAVKVALPPPPKSAEPTTSEKKYAANQMPELDSIELGKKPKLPNLPSLPQLLEKPIEIQAPSKFNHPLIKSDQLYFMLGEDSRGKYLYAEGAVIEGAYDKFIKYVKHFESRGMKLERFMMHSNGGLLNEGLKIGQYIYDNGWTTDADANIQCYSSCGMIYASGANKRMQAGAKVGFHRPYYPNIPDTPEQITVTYQTYLSYWKYIKGNQPLYDKFMQYGRDDMYVLDSASVTKYLPVEIY